MTLYRQLIIALATLFILLYGVNSVVSIYHIQLLVEQQMQVHAQDTATSVALSMTQAAQDQDIATLDTMFNAVSDSGYFREILYTNLDGEILLDRTFPVQVEGVPSWFISAIALPSPQGNAEVASGWMRLGNLMVISHPGQAYQKLWRVTIEQLTWFAVITFLVCLLGAWSLRTLLKPLARVEEQADAICDKQFVEQEQLPRTRELRSVVMAMNRMSKRLKDIFQRQLDLIGQLQEQSQRDTITGLANRFSFDMRLRSFVGADIGSISGVLMILRVDNFQQVNDRAGRAEGNQILLKIGERLTSITNTFSQSVVGRRQGTEFAVFVPNIITVEAEELASTLLSGCSDINWRFQNDSPLLLHMGFTYEDAISDPIELLSEANAALQIARRETASCWRSFAEINEGQVTPMLNTPVDEWRDILEKMIADQSLTLLYQPIFDSNQEVVGHELYSRLKLGDELITAGIFMPMAERFDLAAQFDRLILSKLATGIKDLSSHYLCVNLSLSSIHDLKFQSWLDSFLAANTLLAKYLVIEISEYAMNVEESYVRQLSTLLKRHKVRLGIDHFGLGSAAFGYLSSLPLHHIKIHRSFVYNLPSNPDNNFYIQSVLQVAHSRDIIVMAEGVQQETEWRSLVELGIDSAQGYWLGVPALKPVS